MTLIYIDTARECEWITGISWFAETFCDSVDEFAFSIISTRKIFTRIYNIINTFISINVHMNNTRSGLMMMIMILTSTIVSDVGLGTHALSHKTHGVARTVIFRFTGHDFQAFRVCIFFSDRSRWTAT